MATWITDENGNRASVERWGGANAARASLATLWECRDCTNCKNCTGCIRAIRCTNCIYCTDCTDCTYCMYCIRGRRCTRCTYCTDCTYCADCMRCTDCRYCIDCMRCENCNLSLPNHRLPVSDPRGYTWLAIYENTAWRIRSGCRNFTLAAAREHWLSPYYHGPATVRETVGFALDWLEAKPVPKLAILGGWKGD